MSNRPGPRGGQGGPFDLERVRRNWERAREAPSAAMPTRFAEIAAPRDAIAAGREGLARVRALAKVQFPDRVDTLAAFFAQADGALERIASAAPGADTSADRALLVTTLGDLEDLFEVFAGIGR